MITRLLVLLLLFATPAWAITPLTETFRDVQMHRYANATGNGTPISVEYFTLAAIEVTITGTATVTWEETITGLNFNTGSCVNASAPGTLVTTATASGLFYCNLAPLTEFRARISSFSSGTVTAIARISKLSFMEVFSASSGGAGAVGLTDTQLRANPVPVSGTFYQATQPVSGTFWQATQPVSGTFYQATQPVSGTFWQSIQPVSGTVTANQGGAPWSSNVTQIGGVALAFGQAVMSASIPVTIASNQSALPVTGTFWQATQPISATALPLPTNAAQESGNLATIAAKDVATSAKQDTSNTSLASIDSKMPTTVLSSQPVSVMRSAIPVAPVLPPTVNRLQYAAMMRSYCLQTLCPPIPGGLR